MTGPEEDCYGGRWPRASALGSQRSGSQALWPAECPERGSKDSPEPEALPLAMWSLHKGTSTVFTYRTSTRSPAYPVNSLPTRPSKARPISSRTQTPWHWEGELWGQGCLKISRPRCTGKDDRLLRELLSSSSNPTGRSQRLSSLLVPGAWHSVSI